MLKAVGQLLRSLFKPWDTSLKDIELKRDLDENEADDEAEWSKLSPEQQKAITDQNIADNDRQFKENVEAAKKLKHGNND